MLHILVAKNLISKFWNRTYYTINLYHRKEVERFQGWICNHYNCQLSLPKGEEERRCMDKESNERGGPEQGGHSFDYADPWTV